MTDQMCEKFMMRSCDFVGAMVCHSATCVWDQGSWHRWAVTASTGPYVWCYGLSFSNVCMRPGFVTPMSC